MNRIRKVDKLVNEIMDLLPMIYDSEVDDEFKETHFIVDSNRSQILSNVESEIETIANLLDQLYGENVVTTGYYDPEEDRRNGVVDAYTGLYYVSID